MEDTQEAMAVTTRAAAKRLADEQAKEDKETSTSQANITPFEELPGTEVLDDDDKAVSTLWESITTDDTSTVLPTRQVTNSPPRIPLSAKDFRTAQEEVQAMLKEAQDPTHSTLKIVNGALVKKGSGRTAGSVGGTEVP